LSDVPVVGRLFGRNRKETNQTDVVLTLTPHILRVLDLSEDDLRPFRVSSDANAPLIDLPVIQTPPVTIPPPPPPVQPGPPAQNPAQPGNPPPPAQPAPPIPGTLAPAPPQR
jgi:general secretion pathway protein D